MEIYRLYEAIKKWEVAFTLTKPSDIQSVEIKPVIKDVSECYEEGRVQGSIKFILEREATYATFSILEVYKEYKTVEECSEAQEGMITCLTEYLEEFLEDDFIKLIWKQFGKVDLEWHEKQP